MAAVGRACQRLLIVCLQRGSKNALQSNQDALLIVLAAATSNIRRVLIFLRAGSLQARFQNARAGDATAANALRDQPPREITQQPYKMFALVVEFAFASRDASGRLAS